MAKEKKKGKGCLVFILIIVAVVLVAALIGKNNNSDKSTQTEPNIDAMISQMNDIIGTEKQEETTTVLFEDVPVETESSVTEPIVITTEAVTESDNDLIDGIET